MIARSLTLAVLLATSALAQQEKLKLTILNGQELDFAGKAVGVDGDTIIMGAQLHDEFGDSSGSAFLFDAHGGGQLHQLNASDAAPGDEFGSSVDISGERAIVGSPSFDYLANGSGRVYVFDVATGSEIMTLRQFDPNKGARFGFSVAIDGDVAIVGAPGDGPNAGAAYLFDLTTGLLIHKLQAPGVPSGRYFGHSVDVHGGTAIVGNKKIYVSSAWVFDVATGAFLQRISPPSTRDFGHSVAIFGDKALVGDPSDGPLGWNSGVAYLIDLPSGTWQKLIPADGRAVDHFGWSVDLDGQHLLIGARGVRDHGLWSGSAYIYDAATAEQRYELHASDAETDDGLGWDVCLSGDLVICGAPGDDDLGFKSGAGYLFQITTPGTNYCGPAVPNSSGLSAVIEAHGSDQVGDNYLFVSAHHLPANRFGYFIAGPTQGFISGPGGSQGNLCITGSMGRYDAPRDIFDTGPAGIASLPIDLTQVPFPNGGHTILPGETWNWTAWFRDAGNTSNFTDAVSVLFQ